MRNFIPVGGHEVIFNIQDCQVLKGLMESHLVVWLLSFKI